MPKVSRATLARLPLYLNFLKSSDIKNKENISATAIAKELGLGDVQVRKDLGTASGEGKPKTGYNVSDLIDRLEFVLGYKKKNSAVIVGAGRLGRALLEYDGFDEYGLDILAAFDRDKSKLGRAENGKEILSMDDFDNYCKKSSIKIGIITVPAPCAQSICDEMAKNNFSAVWNFAPTRLSAPNGMIVQNENMALSLAMLSGQINI